jgi:hypothetical protein
MTILVVPLQHRFAGTFRSRHHARFIPMPASAGGRSRTNPHQAIEYRSNAQSAIISALQLSAIFAKPSTATAAPTPNPHSRRALTAFPRVRSSEAFRRRPLYRVDRSRPAGIRNPSRFRTFPPSPRCAKLRPHQPFDLPTRASETGPCRGRFGDIGSKAASRVGATPNANLPIRARWYSLRRMWPSRQPNGSSHSASVPHGGATRSAHHNS